MFHAGDEASWSSDMIHTSSSRCSGHLLAPMSVYGGTMLAKIIRWSIEWRCKPGKTRNLVCEWLTDNSTRIRTSPGFLRSSHLALLINIIVIIIIVVKSGSMHRLGCNRSVPGAEMHSFFTRWSGLGLCMSKHQEAHARISSQHLLL